MVQSRTYSLSRFRRLPHQLYRGRLNCEGPKGLITEVVGAALSRRLKNPYLKGGDYAMKRFVIREVETLKTTAAMYGDCMVACCEVEPGVWVCCDDINIGIG